MTAQPRILFVADLNYYAKGAQRLAALGRLGYAVEALSHTPLGGDADGHPSFSLAFRFAWKLGVHMDTEAINRTLPDAAGAQQPDVIWIEKGNMVKPATLRLLREVCPGAVIASYSEDDMYNPLNRTLAYQWGLKHYDVIFVTKSYNADKGELPSLGAKHCVVVDKAYDPEQHMPIEITEAEREELGADVGFIGTYASEREVDLRFLANNGIDVRVWGNGWEKAREDENLRVEKRALVNRPDDLRYTKGISATKINLGFLRKVNRDLQTDRSIEIPAAGGFMLAEYSDEHARLFADGQEAVFYHDPDDLLAKVRHYLADDEARSAIAAAGRQRCLNSGYSHDERMRFMIETAMKQRRSSQT